jgi:hypothetical protein
MAGVDAAAHMGKFWVEHYFNPSVLLVWLYPSN